MNKLVFTTLFFILFAAAGISAQSSWLDRSLSQNWNTGNGVVPRAPRIEGSRPQDDHCKSQIRTPAGAVDLAVTRAGWTLFGPTISYGNISIVTAMVSVDGMCRPNQYNGFVFVGSRFAGTLAPTVSNSRTDAALGRISLYNPEELMVEFSRYAENDAMCCPSRTSLVSYELTTGTRAVVKAVDVSTTANCDENFIGTQDNVISGTVTYRDRRALPPTAVLNVKLLDVSRADAASVTIAETNIETAGKQVPFSFDFAYERSKIQERNRYVVRAEIRDGERLLYTTDLSHPVLTYDSGKTVDIVVIPVRGQGVGTGTGQNLNSTIRGTVTYRERIALMANSEVTVKLVDATDPNAQPIGETTFSSARRNVPLQYELRYDSRDISRQRKYELRAEIRDPEGKLTFRTAEGVAVDVNRPVTSPVELVLIQGSDEPEAITGQNISLSKFGTGNLRIGDRSNEVVIRGTVTIRTDGTADVSLTRINGTIVFSGILTSFDNNILKITIQNSGNADAGGEIEVRYSNRNLNAVIGNELVLDGQNVTLRF